MATPAEPWGKQDNRRTAHLVRARQNEKDIMTIGMTESQLLELQVLISNALREKKDVAHGRGEDALFYLAIRPSKTVKYCHANPPCQGGEGSIALVRPAVKKKVS